MTRLILSAAVLAVCGACGNNGPTAPSVNPTAKTETSVIIETPGTPVRVKPLSATVTVLDGENYSGNCPGLSCRVTKYPNYPAMPPSPVYLQRISSNQDPCPLKWSGYHAAYKIDEDDDPSTPWIYWCQQ